MQDFHPESDHRPEWRIRGDRTWCVECSYYAVVFACSTCGQVADESVIGHGSFGQGSHFPTRLEAK